MQKKLLDFAALMGLKLSDRAVDLLVQYVELVWQKKDTLNLTSVSDKNEIITRHICDGLVAANLVTKEYKGQKNFTAADMGCGAGYIGLVIAIVLPEVKVVLVESLQRRCAFLNWAIMKLGLTNVQVLCVRLGQADVGLFDIVTERAMGQLEAIFPLIVPTLKESGRFLAYQSVGKSGNEHLPLQMQVKEEKPYMYRLPDEQKDRYIRIFLKHGHH